MSQRLLVIGAGGHAKVVIDIAEVLGTWEIAAILADGPEASGRRVLGFPVVGRTDQITEFADRETRFIVAIGSNVARERLQTASISAGLIAATLVHPSAVVARSAVLGEGSVVMAGAVVNSEAQIGRGVIINTGAIVDHDCRIGDYVHIAPGVRLCGSVSVGARALLGVGASATPGISVGRDCIVGAGSAVIRHVPDGARVAGVPARPI